MNLKYFFNPQSIIIIGASKYKKKVGRQILDNIIKRSYPGKLYPVNLNEKRIAGLKVYHNIDDIAIKEPSKSLVVIAIPAPVVLSEVETCAQLGFKNIVIISAGFKESGKEGKIREENISKLAKKYKLNILGPNCLGFINLFNNINATFTRVDNRVANIALLSQSGAVGSAALDWFQDRNIGLSYFVSLGNKVAINENDLLEYLAHDKRVEMIAMYLEEISDGQELMSLISRISKQKPIVILKSGRGKEGKELALSHTGSLAGATKIIEQGLKESGAIYVNTLLELLNFSVLANSQYYNKESNDLSIITNAGGLAVLSADAINNTNIKLKHSIDVLGDASAENYYQALKALLKDKQVNNILVLLTPQNSTEEIKTARVIINLSKKYKKLIITSFVGGSLVKESNKLLAMNNIPYFNFPEEAIKTLSYLNHYRYIRKNITPYIKRDKIISEPVEVVDYLKSLKLLETYNFNVAQAKRLENHKGIKFPVVLKAVGPDFIHKSDQQAVITNINNRAELIIAEKKMKKGRLEKFENKSNYLIIQKQLPSDLELILGIKRDPSFGPVIIIGLGGIYTEVFKDIKMIMAGFNRKHAKEFVSNLPFYPILKGTRGQRAYNITALIEAMMNLSILAIEHPEINELDINPAFINSQGLQVVDVRIIS